MATARKPLSGIQLFRIILWSIVAVIAVVLAALLTGVWHPPASRSFAGLTGAPFTLQATTGGDFTQASLAGTPTALFFGYTFCPDVCPTTLTDLAAVEQQLKLSPDKFRVVFATVDPGRDTLSVLKTYLANFGPSFIGLTGTDAEVEQAKAAFGIYSKKGPDDGTGTYLVDHTATVFLLGKAGEFEGTIAYGEDQKAATEKIKRLVGT